MSPLIKDTDYNEHPSSRPLTTVRLLHKGHWLQWAPFTKTIYYSKHLLQCLPLTTMRLHHYVHWQQWTYLMKVTDYSDPPLQRPLSTVNLLHKGQWTYSTKIFDKVSLCTWVSDDTEALCWRNVKPADRLVSLQTLSFFPCKHITGCIRLLRANYIRTDNIVIPARNMCNTGWARLNRSLSSARFYFELSGNSNYIIHCKSNYVQNFELEINSIWNFDLGFTLNYCFELWLSLS